MLDKFLWGHSSRVCDISCLALKECMNFASAGASVSSGHSLVFSTISINYYFFIIFLFFIITYFCLSNKQ